MERSSHKTEAHGVLPVQEKRSILVMNFGLGNSESEKIFKRRKKFRIFYFAFLLDCFNFQMLHKNVGFFTLVLRQAKFPTEDHRAFMATNQISSHEAGLNINEQYHRALAFHALQVNVARTMAIVHDEITVPLDFLHIAKE